MTRCLCILILTLLATASCTLPSNSEGGAMISGTVIYRERMAVSPRAVVRVALEDVSKMDVAATLIAETRFLASGGPPYAFALGYDPAKIDDRHRYSLRATITLDDRLLFTSTEHIEPFGQGSIEILVRRAGAN